MSLNKVLYVGQAVADQLIDSIDENVDRYSSEGFQDLAEQGNWEIATNLTYDPGPLKELDPARTAEAEINNSILVWRSLSSLTPSLATENRIWIRFTHLECLGFSQKRWLEGKTGEALTKAIRAHFFADTRTRWRDDNAVSRLWWNYWIAQRLMPEDPEKALSIIFRSTDMRLNTVERPGLFIRPAISAGILRTFARDEWVLAREERWRNFMTELNKAGAGKVFEAMKETEIDQLMNRCLDRAKSALAS
ncbi:hypothetical protein KUV44_14280 [Marinobacter daepoensis]|uniref:Uncharacterized protein n=1 Tax=Marinobacter daepoensis TaxID=262077 RepID=A0ABS3BI77_9GAMM|nr:DUF6339 family protein [Marinobacter daepoensis]MBN7769925.1 hypothetical protein [Marinobacter daepoensis]MBY6080313.1 hypothetical protein [Marinobacter daepoensis]